MGSDFAIRLGGPSAVVTKIRLYFAIFVILYSSSKSICHFLLSILCMVLFAGQRQIRVSRKFMFSTMSCYNNTIFTNEMTSNESESIRFYCRKGKINQYSIAADRGKLVVPSLTSSRCGMINHKLKARFRERTRIYQLGTFIFNCIAPPFFSYNKLLH